MPPLPDLLGLSMDELKALTAEAGQPVFRARQLFKWLYADGVESTEAMTNLPAGFRGWIAERYAQPVADAEVARTAGDGSRKLLHRLADGKAVESVLMPERDWTTLCVSSQVGCAVACTFCMTGFGGFRRQMTVGEIVGQVLAARRVAAADGGAPPRNIVFMGMGEPMLNLDAVIPALRILIDHDGPAIAPRRITVSTSGIIPGIERLGAEDLGVNLAISLNASNDAFRDEVMPINRKYPIAELLDACRRFPLRNRRLITFEYVMLAGLNDGLDQADELAALLADMPGKINLIPWNPDPHLPYRRPPDHVVRRFQSRLATTGHAVTVRFSKADDVGGACGQLAGHWKAEQELPA